ncbi:secreted protein [Beggiatoa sp. PS]|nr:secreted protein [Beggiatoa sp. PS]
MRYLKYVCLLIGFFLTTALIAGPANGPILQSIDFHTPVNQVDANWYIILGSYSHNKRGKKAANKHSNWLIEEGFDEVFVADTNNYDNLADELYAVMMGPYTKRSAKIHLRDIKHLVKEAYMKKASSLNE